MLEYFDGTYTVLNDTILAVNSFEKHLYIPDKLGDCTIVRIGAGCSLGNKTGAVHIAEGIREIGERAFVDAKELRILDLPESLETCNETILSNEFYGREAGNHIILKRCISEADRDMLMKNSLELEDGNRILTGAYHRLPFFTGVFSGFYRIIPPAFVCREMNGLYCTCEEPGKADQYIFKGRRLRVQGEHGYVKNNFEDEIVRLMLKEKPEYIFSNRSEERSDRLKQSEGKLMPKSVMMTGFRESDTVLKEDGVHMVFHIDIGKFWFYSLMRIRYRGEDYGILRKTYLSSSVKEPFLNEDLTDVVYDKNGEHAVPAAKEGVLSKYRLLSMLS